MSLPKHTQRRMDHRVISMGWNFKIWVGMVDSNHGSLSRYSTTEIFHPMVDQFLPVTIKLLWKAFSHAVIIAKKIFLHLYPPLLQPNTNLCTSVSLCCFLNFLRFEIAVCAFDPRAFD